MHQDAGSLDRSVPVPDVVVADAGIDLPATDTRPRPDALPPDVLPPVDLNFAKCAPAKKVSPTALAGMINAMSWQVVGLMTTKPLSTSEDYQLSGAVVLNASSIPLSTTCPGASYCPKPAFVLTNQSVPGTTCLKWVSSFGLKSCSSMKFEKGSTVRFRKMIEVHHPSYALHILMVLPACKTPCSSGWHRCYRDNTCWPHFTHTYQPMESFCRLCLGYSKNRCVCTTSTGPKTNGKYCQYHYSADQVASGKCVNGTCVKQ